MLSRATYVGRICLSCRYQLQLTRPRPLPATTRFPRLGLPRYSTGANDESDSNPSPSQSRSEESRGRTGQDDPATAPQASEHSADDVPSAKAKPAESSAEAASTSNASSEGSQPTKPENGGVELEIDTPPASEAELAWADLHTASQPPEPQRAPQPTERGPRRQRGRGGVDIETTSLGMNILGKEGHTIVLRDRERRRKEPDTLEDETPAEDFDIEESLEEQSRDITTEETRRNIEELRPGDSRDLMGREFDKILNTLMDGFTTSQLEDYVCYFVRRAEGKSEVMSEPQKKHLLKRLTGHQRAELRWPVPPRYGWIRQQFSWKPPKNYPWGNTMKEKLVLAIMRTCWHLQVMEETPYIGQVNATVDPHILNLLLVENKSLRAVQHSLGAGGSIRIVPEKEMMQITASRSKCDAALDQLDRFVSRIEESTIPLSALGPGRLPDGILEHLSSLTGASITYDGAKAGSAPSNERDAPATPTQDNSDAIRIAWVKATNRPDTVESLEHVIFRLLLSTKRPRNSSETVKTVLDNEVPVGPKTFVLRRHHGDNHELPWNLRDQIWSRLVYPSQTKPNLQKRGVAAFPEKLSTGQTSADSSNVASSAEDQERPEAPSSHTKAEARPTHGTGQQDAISLSALRLPISRRQGTPAPEGWSPNFRRTSSVFGHLLHPFLTSKQRSTLDYRKPVDPNSLHLKPVLPPVAALTNLAAEAEDAATTTTVLIRLWPKQEGAPRLEFHLDVPEEGGPLEWETTTKRLLAVRYSWAAHVRLPFLPVDVDVRQLLTSEMDASALASSAPLRTFFDNSKLDLSSDLLTPSSLNLSIPSSFMSMEDEEGETEVGYYFMGLELHTSSTVPFRSNLLSLTSIEAGQQGRRTELALHPPDIDPSETRDRGRQYLDEVLRLAQGKYFPWVGSRPVDASLEDS